MPRPRRHAVLAAAALGAGLLGGAVPAADAEVVWLCRPGLANDPCEIPLDTTVRQLDGGERVETPRRVAQDRRPIDCFYVYPTVSNQPTLNANKDRDPELVSIAKYQAARFSTQCRIYAPVYRQGTLAGLASGRETETRGPAYADVLEAWNEYLARHNGGRGVVLIGHSQGTRMLRALLRQEIDPRPEQRRRLVGGVLLGGNYAVLRGKNVGGDAQHVPVCTRYGEVGCIVAFSTFQNDPPDNARYGKVETTPDGLGFPRGGQYEVACTDPGRLSRMTGPFGLTIPTEPFAPGAILAGIAGTYGGAPPPASTTWLTPRDRWQGTCRTIEGANVLRYEPVGDSRRLRHQPTNDWGTHLVDLNLGVEREVAIVAAQARRWLDAQPGRAPAPRRCTAPRSRWLRVAVTPRRARRGARTRFSFRITRLAGRRLVPVAGARVRFAGRTLTTNARGRATRTRVLPRAGRYLVVASRAGVCTGRGLVRATTVRPR